MNWVLAGVLSIAVVETLLRLPLTPFLGEITRVGRRALKTLARNAVSDHWKERAIWAYARLLFVSTAKLAALLLAVGIFAGALTSGLEIVGGGISDFLVSGTGLLFSCLISLLYYVTRRVLV